MIETAPVERLAIYIRYADVQSRDRQLKVVSELLSSRGLDPRTAEMFEDTGGANATPDLDDLVDNLGRFTLVATCDPARMTRSASKTAALLTAFNDAGVRLMMPGTETAMEPDVPGSTAVIEGASG